MIRKRGKKPTKHTNPMKESKVAKDGVMQFQFVQQQGLVQARVVKSPCPASCCPTLLGSRAALQDNPGSYQHHSKALAPCSTAVLCLWWGLLAMVQPSCRKRWLRTDRRTFLLFSGATARLLLMKSLMGQGSPCRMSTDIIQRHEVTPQVIISFPITKKLSPVKSRL